VQQLDLGEDMIALRSRRHPGNLLRQHKLTLLDFGGCDEGHRHDRILFQRAGEDFSARGHAFTQRLYCEADMIGSHSIADPLDFFECPSQILRGGVDTLVAVLSHVVVFVRSFGQKCTYARRFLAVIGSCHSELGFSLKAQA